MQYPLPYIRLSEVSMAFTIYMSSTRDSSDKIFYIIIYHHSIPTGLIINIKLNHNPGSLSLSIARPRTTWVRYVAKPQREHDKNTTSHFYMSTPSIYTLCTYIDGVDHEDASGSQLYTTIMQRIYI